MKYSWYCNLSGCLASVAADDGYFAYSCVACQVVLFGLLLCISPSSHQFLSPPCTADEDLLLLLRLSVSTSAG